MAGDMNVECVSAIWSVVKLHAYMEQMLIHEGRLQDAAAPKDWQVYPLATPQEVVYRGVFDIYSEELARVLEGVAKECQAVYPESPPAEQLTAFGAVEDFKSPFARDSEADPYELWLQLGAIEDAVLDWIDSIFLEPSRYAMAGVPR